MKGCSIRENGFSFLKIVAIAIKQLYSKEKCCSIYDQTEDKLKQIQQCPT